MRYSTFENLIDSCVLQPIRDLHVSLDFELGHYHPNILCELLLHFHRENVHYDLDRLYR